MNSAADVWAKVLDILVDEFDFSSVTISTWFNDTTAVSVNGDTLVLVTSNWFKKEQISNTYADKICEALKILFSIDMKLSIFTEDEISTEKTEQLPQQTDDDFSFEHFVVGNSNKLAHAAAQAVANSPASIYNPLLIYGGSGLGKTHLLNAIANNIRKNHPDYNIVYVSGENFTNELIDSIKDGTVSNFRNKYRSSDLLLVDDVQFIAGKERTQEEFFHTFNALTDARKQIVLASDRLPSEMTTLEDRLRTRFESGLITDVQAPDYETRMAIISLKATRLGLNIPQELKSLIANTITSNVRQIEGTVKKILAYRDLLSTEVTLETVERAIEDMIKENPGMNPTPEIVITEVSRYFNIPEEEITGKNRSKDTVFPRQVAMYLTRDIVKTSYPDIGKIFGRDHSTVLHSVNKIEVQVKSNEAIKKQIRDIKNNVLGS